MQVNRSILLLVTVAVALIALLFFINQHPREAQPVPITLSGNMRPNMTSQPVSNNYTIFVSRDICEGCHMSGKSSIPQALSVEPHVSGGAYCLACHKFSHETHPINQNVTCEKCHGATPAKPVFVNGSISCNNCHGYPDALSPSKGNLITIHMPRGVTCSACHTDECTKCHTEIGSNERWEKRLEHFRALLNIR